MFLPFTCCGGPVFPCVPVSWSFGGLGFCVVFVLLVLFRDVLGFAFGGSLGLMISVVVAVQVLGSHVQAVRGGCFASVSPFRGLGSRRVCSSSHLRIPSDLAATVAWGARRAEGVVVNKATWEVHFFFHNSASEWCSIEHHRIYLIEAKAYQTHFIRLKTVM